MNENASKRIAIFTNIENIESSSSIINIIESLSSEGFVVDLFSPNCPKEAFNQSLNGINIYSKKHFGMQELYKDLKQGLYMSLLRCFFSRLQESIKINGIKVFFFMQYL